jgi:hypothetical protein
VARAGSAADEAPPARDAVQPGGADGNAGVGDARVVCQPVPHGTPHVAGQMVGELVGELGGELVSDTIPVALRLGRIE